MESLSLLLRLRDSFAACQGPQLVFVLLGFCFGCAVVVLEAETTAPAGELQVLGFTESGKGGRVHMPTAMFPANCDHFSIFSKEQCAHPSFYATEARKEPSEASLGTLFLKLQNT